MKFQPSNLRERAVAAGREVHEDESGAMMIIGLFFALFLVGALYYLLGIGQAIFYRERMQDAADTAAFAGAVLKARAMNFIALINMVMALLLAILIAIYAIYLLLAAAGYVILPGICAAAWICPPCAVACGLIGPVISAANTTKQIYETAKRIIEPIIRAGSTAGEAISKGAPFAAAGASYVRVASTYNAQAAAGFSLGNPPLGRLPSRKAPYSELCRKAKSYANKPYEALERIIPIVGTVLRWVGGAFTEAAAAVVCEGSTTPPDLGSLGRSREPAGERPAFILPRTADQNDCLLNGNDAACRRFQDWQRQSQWDTSRGICQDIPGNPTVFTATLPAGATEDECNNRVRRAAGEGCMQRNPARYDYLYAVQEMRQTVRKDTAETPAAALFPALVASSRIDGPHERPLCGEGGTWPNSARSGADLRNDMCLRPDSIRVEPPLPAGFPRPSTIVEARSLAQRALDEAGLAGSSYIVTWTRVYNVLGCKEPLPPRTGEIPSVPSGDCRMRPQWVMPQNLQMGDEPFQVWGVVLGNDPGADRFLPGVRAANRFRDGGDGIGTVASLAQTLGRFSYAQAEFYYDGPDAGDSKEWLWNMGWTARLRRVRMPGSLRNGGGGVSEVASSTGRGGGGGFGSFNLGSIAETLIIH